MSVYDNKLINYGNLAEFHSKIIDDSSVSTLATWSSQLINNELADKQDVLTAGTGIDISNGVISATGGGSVDMMVEITYAELKVLRDNKQLVSGQQYRITDYVTTCVENAVGDIPPARSAGHQFDIIVTADSEDKLNENARAIQHSGDTYFDNSKLDAWELKYCLDNDTNRFSWAQVSGGTGVIYHMKDEWNNECPYDFKNIQFQRTVDNTNIYCYTFSFWYDDSDNRILDTTIFGNDGTLLDDANGIVGVYGNIIRDYYVQIYAETPLNLLTLSNNIFLAKESFDGGCFYGCFGNIFGINCYNNAFGDSCFCNIFGDYSFSNTLGDYCRYNTFGKSCNGNIFGQECEYNVLECNCEQIKFGDNCEKNTFRGGCRSLDFTTNYSTSYGNKLQYITIFPTYSGALTVPSGIVLNALYSQIVGLNSQGVFTVKNPLD